MTATNEYLGATFPSRIVRVSGTTLFHVAARELGDATAWYRVAALNGGLVDPWLTTPTELKVPKPAPSNGGVPNG